MAASRLRVAVVEDEVSVRKAISRLLRVSGFEVETFASGIAFLESLSSRRPDCVVLDLYLPGLNGFEVQGRLAEMKMRVPIVVITGQDEPGASGRAIAAGAAAYLLKPLEGFSLLEALRLAIAENRPAL